MRLGPGPSEPDLNVGPAPDWIRGSRQLVEASHVCISPLLKLKKTHLPYRMTQDGKAMRPGYTALTDTWMFGGPWNTSWFLSHVE